VQKKKEEPVLELTPLEKMLQNAGPVRKDGSDKFFGLENVSLPALVLYSSRC
jgi:ubiquitin carboxyl-terminal hydrolase 9/13